MATTISTQDIIDAKRDIDDIGEAVNEVKIVSPRYGEDFKSLPMISAEFQISSDAAEAAAISAEESANIAEAAATAATIGAGVFETPEAGVDPVTGVADGAYFNVRSSSDESYVDEYQNVGGSAVATGKSYPSGVALIAVKEAVIDPVTGKAVTGKIFDPDGKTQLFLNSLFRTSQVIDTRLYGVVANTDIDQTTAIHAAFSANPTARKFYIPSGTVLCNIVIPRTYISLIGQGMGVTKLIGFDKTKPTINYNKRLYVHLEDVSVHQKYDATAPIVNARDSRYCSGYQAEFYQLPNDSDEFSYSVRAFDQRPDTVYWTGYNYFSQCRFNRSMYGYDAGGAPLSATSFDDCIFAFNGYFGARLDGVVGGGMHNCDTATNGQIGYRDNLTDETQFGGVWVKGENFNIDGAWHEFNRGKFGFLGETDYPNDIYIHPDSVNVTETNPRRQRSSAGGYLLTQSQAEQTRNSYSDVVIDGGMGTAKHQNLISNGNFKFLLTNWLNANVTVGDYLVITDDMPKGFESTLQLNSTGGIKSLYQKIYEAGQTGNVIDNIAQFAGQTITMTCWVKNMGSTFTSARAGFDTAAIGTNVYFQTGSFIDQTPIGKWVQVVLTHKITGTEPRLFVGFRCTANVLVCGFNVQLGSRVSAYEPTRITENGGEVLGQLNAQAITATEVAVAGASVLTTNDIKVRAATNTVLSSATSAINTDKRHPSFVFNSTNGKMYFSTGTTATAIWRATDGTGDITPV